MGRDWVSGRLAIGILCGLLAIPACAGEAESQPNGVAEVSVADLVDHFDANAGRRVKVVGLLVNRGTNYFTHRNIVLVDPVSGKSIAVRPWLPIEVYPANDADTPQASTMANFLDRQVELTVTPTKAPVKGLGVVPVLEVHAARVVVDR